MLSIALKKTPNYITTRSFKNYRAEQFSDDIAHIPWNTVGCVMESVDRKVNAFNDLFLTCLDNHAPIKTVKLKRKPNPSITSEDCLSDKPGKLQITKQVDPLGPPLVNPPTQNPLALLELAGEKLTKMVEEDGNIGKEKAKTP